MIKEITRKKAVQRWDGGFVATKYWYCCLFCVEAVSILLSHKHIIFLLLLLYISFWFFLKTWLQLHLILSGWASTCNNKWTNIIQKCGATLFLFNSIYLMYLILSLHVFLELHNLGRKSESPFHCNPWCFVGNLSSPFSLWCPRLLWSWWRFDDT